MGQILNRLKRFIESERNFDKTIGEDTDNELKRIIDELNQKTQNSDSNYKNNDSNNKNKSDKDDSQRNSKINSLEDAYRILELSQNPSEEEIRAAYLKKMKEYHPDKVQNLGEEIRVLAERKTTEINQAYEYIKNIRNLK